MFQSYLFWVFCFTKPTNWESVACSSSSVTTSDTSYWKFKTIASEKETICIICNCFKIFITIKMDVQTTTSYLCNNIETNNPLQAWWVGPRSANQHRLYIISYSYNTYFGCQRYPRPEAVDAIFCCCSQSIFKSSGTSFPGMLDIICTRSAWSSDAISTISELSLAMTFSWLILYLFSAVSFSTISVLDRYRLLHLGFSARDDSRLLLILPSWCFAWTQFTQLSPCVLFVRTRQLDENTLASDASSSSRRSRTSCLIYKSGRWGCQQVNWTWNLGKS